MPYIFTNKVFGEEVFFGVEYASIPEEEKALFEINSSTWNTAEINDLLEQIDELEKEKALQYQVEGGHLGIVIKGNNAYFLNIFDAKGENADFEWSLQKFIDFLNDFRAYLEGFE